MKTETYKSDALKRFMQSQIVATLQQMKTFLSTSVTKTIMRKLARLNYINSYSHRGSYYSLVELAQFNKLGLWFIGDVRFSQYGTLLNTLENFICKSENGCFTHELKECLCVSVKESLIRLIKAGRITRQKVSGLYLYCSSELETQKKQLMNRQSSQSDIDSEEISDETYAAILLFASMLDEQQRRLFAGLESMMWGYGGDRKIADLLGINKNTVAKGRRQLINQDVNLDKIRKAGGGRKSVKKKRQNSLKKLKS